MSRQAVVVDVEGEETEDLVEVTSVVLVSFVRMAGAMPKSSTIGRFLTGVGPQARAAQPVAQEVTFPTNPYPLKPGMDQLGALFRLGKSRVNREFTEKERVMLRADTEAAHYFISLKRMTMEGEREKHVSLNYSNSLMKEIVGKIGKVMSMVENEECIGGIPRAFVEEVLGRARKKLLSALKGKYSPEEFKQIKSELTGGNEDAKRLLDGLYNDMIAQSDYKPKRRRGKDDDLDLDDNLSADIGEALDRLGLITAEIKSDYNRQVDKGTDSVKAHLFPSLTMDEMQYAKSFLTPIVGAFLFGNPMERTQLLAKTEKTSKYLNDDKRLQRFAVQDDLVQLLISHLINGAGVENSGANPHSVYPIEKPIFALLGQILANQLETSKSNRSLQLRSNCIEALYTDFPTKSEHLLPKQDLFRLLLRVTIAHQHQYDTSKVSKDCIERQLLKDSNQLIPIFQRPDGKFDLKANYPKALKWIVPKITSKSDPESLEFTTENLSDVQKEKHWKFLYKRALIAAAEQVSTACTSNIFSLTNGSVNCNTTV